MSTTSPITAEVDKNDQSDIFPKTTKLTEPINDLPEDFTISPGLREQLILPLSDIEMTSIDPFADLKRLDRVEREYIIDSYWRNNNHVDIPESIVNVLLFTIIMWMVAFLMSLGLLVLWKF